MKIHTSTVSFGLVIVLFSCVRHSSDSALQWEIDLRNDPANFEIETGLQYAEIANHTSIETGVPWTDTYWPLVNKGVSRRWGESEHDPVGGSLGFLDFLTTHFEVTEAAATALLSPAEKHDLVRRHQLGLNDTRRALRDHRKKLQTFEADIDASESVSDKKKKAKELLIYMEGGSTTNLRSLMPLSLDGWRSWLSRSASPDYQFAGNGEGEDWGWMGHCHGWAPASLIEDAPKHAVMVKLGDREVLFTEGDIRGLLTKAWADNSPNESTLFIGRRCNENVTSLTDPLPHDSEGRTLGGVLSDTGGEEIGFHEITQRILPNRALNRQEIVDTLFLVAERKTVYYVENRYVGSQHLVFESQNALHHYLLTGETDRARIPSEVNFYGCRDVNPASLHTILVKFLGKPWQSGKNSFRFVMDRTRSGQVWNQPVYRADIKVGKLELVTDLDVDRHASHHAAETQYVAEISADVYWSGEPARPSMAYPLGYDARYARNALSLRYTLEFDSAERLIGGEWGHLDENEASQRSPDFLFAFREGATPVDTSAIRYSDIIKPIHLCSLNPEAPHTIEVAGEVLSYSECILSP